MTNLIVKTVFGSHLYGLNTPESDTDYKGIFMPCAGDILLGRIPKQIDLSTNKTNTKNDRSDVDCQLFSLHEFIRLACRGETMAIDMLHANANHIVERGDQKLFKVWEYLVDHRQSFYCKDMSAFMGYVRKQAHKYGVKGSRLKTAQAVLNDLNIKRHILKDVKLREVKEALPNHLEHTEWVKIGTQEFFMVCGRKLPMSITISQAFDIVNKIVHSYGARAEQASNNQNIDWKAISHALRAGYQLLDIYELGDFEYPLKQTQFLKDVKAGKLDFQHNVQLELESLVQRVEEASLNSTFPKHVDASWDIWLAQTTRHFI